MSRTALVAVARRLGVALVMAGVLAAPTVLDAADNLTPERLQRLRAATANGGLARVIVKYRFDERGRPPRWGDRGAAAVRARAARRGRIAAIRTRLMRRLGLEARRVRDYRSIPAQALEITEEGLDALMIDPDVESIKLDFLMRPTLGSSTIVIGSNTVNNQGFTGAGQTIAILDTGVDFTHPFLKIDGVSKSVDEACFSSTQGGTPEFFFLDFSTTVCPNGAQQQIGAPAGRNCPLSIFGCDHGTHVAGIAAGHRSGTGRNFDGVAPDAKIISIQVFSRFTSICAFAGFPSPCALTLFSDVQAAADWALSEIDGRLANLKVAAANLSLGGNVPFPTPCDGPGDGKPTVDALRAVGIATVIAAGNDGFTNGLSEPACISSAISVGATTDGDTVASFSNVATYLDLYAPGVSVQSSVPGGGFSFFDGTSMSAPHVAGAFAVLRQADPGATVSQIEAALKNTGVLVNGVPRIRLDQAILQFLKPDLVALWGKLEPGCLASETDCRIKGEVFVQNKGNAASQLSRLQFYHSTDGTLQRTTDTKLFTTSPEKRPEIKVLTPNEFVRLKVKVPLPGVTDTANDSVFVYADDGETNAETDETNNADRVTFAGPFVPGATVAQTASAQNTNNLTTYTFPAQSLGEAAGDRKIVVGVVYSASPIGTISSLTVAGITATSRIAQTTSGGGEARVEIFEADVPTGTTGDIVVTMSKANFNCSIGVWRVTGAAAATNDTGASTAVPLNDTLDIPAGGVAVGIATQGGNSSTWTWANLTEDFDTASETTDTYTGASSAFTDEQSLLSITATSTGAPLQRALALVSWGPS